MEGSVEGDARSVEGVARSVEDRWKVMQGRWKGRWKVMQGRRNIGGRLMDDSALLHAAHLVSIDREGST